MKKIAFIFPGQGSQSVGMCRGFYDGYPAVRAVFEEAGDALGYDVARLSFEGPSAELDRTENTQPALLTASIAALRVFTEVVGVKPAALSGHSLGEYTALVAAGALSFADAVRLVRLRGRFMQEGVPAGAGRMCAILGLGIDDVVEICKEASTPDSVVVAANINSPEQIVISGRSEAVDRAAEIAKGKGAKRVIPLQVSAPSHSPLMQAAAERLLIELSKITFKDPSAPVITNVEATALMKGAQIPGLLVRQLTSPVRWVDIVRCMKANGITTTVEIGPGKVLSGLVKRIEKEIETFSFGEVADVQKTGEALK